MFDKLIIAIKSKNLEEINRLIELGVDVNLEDGRALTEAVQIGNLKIVNRLIEAGADVDKDNGKYLCEIVNSFISKTPQIIESLTRINELIEDLGPWSFSPYYLKLSQNESNKLRDEFPKIFKLMNRLIIAGSNVDKAIEILKSNYNDLIYYEINQIIKAIEKSIVERDFKINYEKNKLLRNNLMLKKEKIKEVKININKDFDLFNQSVECIPVQNQEFVPKINLNNRELGE